MEWLITRMETKRTFTFSSLFTGQITVRLLVATFLALLELTRMGRISLSQDEAFEDINCEARDTPQKPLESSAEPDTVTA